MCLAHLPIDHVGQAFCLLPVWLPEVGLPKETFSWHCSGFDWDMHKNKKIKNNTLKTKKAKLYADQNSRTLTLHPHWSNEKMWEWPLTEGWFLNEKEAGLLALRAPGHAGVWEEASAWREHRLYSVEKHNIQYIGIHLLLITVWAIMNTNNLINNKCASINFNSYLCARRSLLLLESFGSVLLIVVENHQRSIDLPYSQFVI